MDLNFRPFFEKYEEIARQTDKLFETVEKQFPDCVTCKQTCSDCCHALFDLSLIEAVYLNHHFNRLILDQEKALILDKANRADRVLFRIKRDASRAHQKGLEDSVILSELAREKVRCPLLDENDLCRLYEYRPVTCRIYGIPTSIAGEGHTCGLTGFEKGKPYPTVHLEKLHEKLYRISEDLVRSIPTQYKKLAYMLVPVSMALLTDYTPEYLGIPIEDGKDSHQTGKKTGEEV